MPVTNYYSVGGHILAESTSGVATEYVTDALGSVIATTNSVGAVQNTYHWAGYGTQIAKAGTGADPKFLWNGTSGYRVTGLAYATHYVRTRHFAARLALWTTIDPYWLQFGAYIYALGEPTSVADRSGQGVTTKRFHMYTDFLPINCDVACWKYWAFWVSDRHYTGWLIQQVTVTYTLHCCNRLLYWPLQPRATCAAGHLTRSADGTTYSYRFWEAWFVKQAQVQAPATGPVACTHPGAPSWVANPKWWDDRWNTTPVSGPCAAGTVETEGELMAYGHPETDLSGLSFACPGSPCSRFNPSTYNFDGFQSDEDGIGLQHYHFGCCASGVFPSCGNFCYDTTAGCETPKCS